MAFEQGGTPLATRTAGVSGEFHSQGNLLLAARTARRRGFTADRMWFIGEPTEDHQGAPMGFTLPVSFVREMMLVGVLIGLLTGLLMGMFLQWEGWGPAFQKLATWLPGGVIIGGLIGLFGGWSALSARIGAYLHNARAGTLRLKIGIPAETAATDHERLAETAERVLREAKAESVLRLDGTVEINSPQSPAYVP